MKWKCTVLGSGLAVELLLIYKLYILLTGVGRGWEVEKEEKRREEK